MILILMTVRLLPLPLLLSLALPLAPIPVGVPVAWVEREAYLMGTTLRVAVAAPERSGGIAAIEEVFAEVRRLEAVLSTWRDDSEIARVNRAETGRALTVSAELVGLLDEAAAWSRATEGAFDPSVGALVDAWDLRGEGRVPSDIERARALRATGAAAFAVNRSSGEVTRRDSLAWLDTGGFGKGAALREAARLLRARGVQSAILNFGGQVLALGADGRGAAWRVPVAHPARRHEPAVELLIRDRSVSTSSQSERGVSVGGRRLGHILDPRSGRPVAPWGSVTVVAEDAVAADVLSTALLVLGPDAALRWAEGRVDYGVLVLVERGDRILPRWNRAMERYLAGATSSTRGG
jgi:thiamine biosynthesis lipoprotein